MNQREFLMKITQELGIKYGWSYLDLTKIYMELIRKKYGK
jgi:hypothetical protein